MATKTTSPKKRAATTKSSSKTTKKPVTRKTASTTSKSKSQKVDYYPNRATFYTAFFAVTVLVLFALLMVPR